MIFVYYLPDLITNPGLLETAKTLDDYDAKMESAWSGFFFTKGHISSVMTKEDVGNKYRLFIMLLFSIPGTPIIFYGEEIGLKDYQASEYPLMRWDNSKYSGFTKGLPWITPDLNSNTPTVTHSF
ncbi:neutral and basic amino acid transport protein rBAT-like isoform X2 [Chiloscyllium plagiosum]|uniref:neutral and basic amino acid transport protein rBAT-like isoform X2 n=1 Tax=Chiloscyllium plagiosum TaxID=36176 RepID=UPI001CB7BBD0|nr:neutral and basic amino acid transport protein rBAT-like isoform X2 [Chiloscyllium plagiosum]